MHWTRDRIYLIETEGGNLPYKNGDPTWAAGTHTRVPSGSHDSLEQLHATPLYTHTLALIIVIIPTE